MQKSYIEWGTIFAGAFVACGLSAVLIQFGAAVGLTQITNELTPDQNITPGGVLAAGIWLMWVQLLSSLAGGYLAGRMRMPIDGGATPHESDLRDGVHGLLVWATSTLIVVLGAFAAGSVGALSAEPATKEIIQTADLKSVQEHLTIIFAFFAASTSLVSAVVAWAAATKGGDHRDSRADHTRYFTFRTIR